MVSDSSLKKFATFTLSRVRSTKKPEMFTQIDQGRALVGQLDLHAPALPALSPRSGWSCSTVTSCNAAASSRRATLEVSAQLAIGPDVHVVGDIGEADFRQFPDDTLGRHFVFRGRLRHRLSLLFTLCLDQLLDASDHVGPVSDPPSAPPVRPQGRLPPRIFLWRLLGRTFRGARF